jgi:hypothetical protein
MKRLLPLIIAALFCIAAAWLPAGGTFTAKKGKFSVEVPSGWMRYADDKGDKNESNFLMITKEGHALQMIIVEKLAFDKDLKFTKKKLRGDMLPHEAAEVVADNIKSNPAITQFELVENSPAQVSGVEGFKLVYTYKSKDGLKSKGVYYGAINKESLAKLHYTAAARYYFDRDLAVFEALVRSFKAN